MEKYKLSCHFVCFVLFWFLEVKTDKTSLVKRNESNKILICNQRELAWAIRYTGGDGGTSRGRHLHKQIGHAEGDGF